MHSWKNENQSTAIGNGFRSAIPIWIRACRPQTLGASMAPVCMGGVLCLRQGMLDGLVFFETLLCAVGLQVLANWANDLYDAKKGVDTQERLGPLRMVQAGLIAPSQMELAILCLICAILFLGTHLVCVGGSLVALGGLASILSAILYTAGPYPLSFLGLGEIFAFVFFGPFAVYGTCLLQGFANGHDALVFGSAPGLVSASLMCVNNLRDREQDARAGKRTLAVRLGEIYTKYILVFLICFGALNLFFWSKRDLEWPIGILFCFGVCGWVASVLYGIVCVRSLREWNSILKRIGMGLLGSALVGLAVVVFYVCGGVGIPFL